MGMGMDMVVVGWEIRTQKLTYPLTGLSLDSAIAVDATSTGGGW